MKSGLSIRHRRAAAIFSAFAMLAFGVAGAQRNEPPPPSAEKQAMIDLGLAHETAWDLYEYFREQADGDTTLAPEEVPDWSGVWTRDGVLFF